MLRERQIQRENLCTGENKVAKRKTESCLSFSEYMNMSQKMSYEMSSGLTLNFDSLLDFRGGCSLHIESGFHVPIVHIFLTKLLEIFKTFTQSHSQPAMTTQHGTFFLFP